MPRFRLLLMLLLAPLCCRCAPPASTGDFHSLDPASKLYAIHSAGESGERKNIPALVEQLDSDDPAVRVFAISALERIIGERLGYNPYADEAGRRDAIERWVVVVKAKRFAAGEK